MAVSKAGCHCLSSGPNQSPCHVSLHTHELQSIQRLLSPSTPPHAHLDTDSSLLACRTDAIKYL